MGNTRFYSLALVLLSLLALALSACSPGAASGAESKEGAPDGVLDYTGLVEALRAGGATVEPAGSLAQPFFSVEGQALKVNSSDVQVFEYESERTAETEAAGIAIDGGSASTADGVSLISGLATPHFYRSGKLIVIYVGDEAALSGLLEGVLGEQFAGR
jgi:hypothetical protein